MIRKIINICTYAIPIVLVTYHNVNYFYANKYLQDEMLEWQIWMFGTTLMFFLFGLKEWLSTFKLKEDRVKRVVYGWLTLFFLADVIGVLLGYNSHSKGFVLILFLIIISGIAHLTAKLWQKYY